MGLLELSVLIFEFILQSVNGCFFNNLIRLFIIVFKDFSPLPQLLANFDSYFLDYFFDRPSLYKVFVMNSVCISNLQVNLMAASLFHCFKFT